MSFALAVAGWIALLLSVVMAAAIGSWNGIEAFLIAAVVIAALSLVFGAIGMRRDRSGLGMTFAVVSVLLAIVLLLACGGWYSIEYRL